MEYFSRIPLCITRIIAIGSFALLVACADEQNVRKIEGFAQGTTYSINIVLPKDAKLNPIKQAIEAEFDRIDLALSNYRDDSKIEQFNAIASTEPQTVEAELVNLVESARNISQASHGCYDLTIKPLFDLWGFKKNEFSPPSDEALTSTREAVGMDKLETVSDTQLRKLNPHLRIDVSSIAQGYTSVRMAKILEDAGINNYLVEVGGELQAKGRKPGSQPWRVAIEKPLPNEMSLQKIASFDSGAAMALVTSGTYRHYFDDEGKRYSHVLDGRTGKPVEHNTVSVVVLHPDSGIADAWATALLCLGSEEGLVAADENRISALFINEVGDDFIELSSRSLIAQADISLLEPTPISNK